MKYQVYRLRMVRWVLDWERTRILQDWYAKQERKGR